MDWSNSLACWVQTDDDRLAKSTRRQPTHLPGMYSRQEVSEYYSDKTGFKVDNFAFYEVYGLFWLAAIAQQIYYRYHHQQTDNQRLKTFFLCII